MSRHRIVLSGRSRAIALITAGAFSVAAVASAAAVTWPREPAHSPTGAVQAAPAAVAAGMNITNHPNQPQASPQAVSLAVRAQQIRAVQADNAVAQWRRARLRSMRRAEALADQSQAAAPAQPTSTATAYAVASGSPEKIAKAMLRSFGWSAGQFSCLYPLWEHESGWSVTAANPDGAYGIPQALPGAKMASAGPDWQTDAATQIRWGLEYIKAMYGSPCGAWDHAQATGWY